MRLLVLVNVFAPDQGGGAAVYSDMCYDLAARFGVEVTVAAPYPFYPEWRDKSGKNGLAVWRYRDNGVAVRRYGLYIPKNPTSLLPRLLFEASILVSMLRAVPLARHVDAVMVYCPHASFLVHGWLIKTLLRKPVWLNVQDVAGDAAAAIGMGRGVFGRLLGVLRGIERALIRSYPLCTTLDPAMQATLAAIRGPKLPVGIIPNWADRRLLEALAAAPPAPARSVDEPRPITLRLLYAGNVGGKQNLLEFCQFLARSDAAFRFKICAAGGQAPAIEAWVAASGDARFEFGPFLEMAEYARELRASDFYVMTEKEGVGSAFFPSKAVVGMTAGAPLLAVCAPESPLGRELAQHPVGPRFSWDELERVSALLRELNAGTGLERIATWRAAALERAKAFERNAILARIAALLAGMVPGAEPRPGREGPSGRGVELKGKTS